MVLAEGLELLEHGTGQENREPFAEGACSLFSSRRGVPGAPAQG